MANKTAYKDFYTYSLIKTLYSKNKSYLETFFPFVLYSIPANKGVGTNKLQISIKKKYGLEIPIFTLEAILKSLKSRNSLIYDEGFVNINLTELGRNQLKEGITENKLIYGDLEKLFEDIRIFINTKSKKIYDNQTIYNELENLIYKNFSSFFTYLSPQCRQELKIKNIDNRLCHLIGLYIEEELNSNGENAITIRKIIYGALLCSVLTQKNFIKDLNHNYSLNKLTIFLDSNIIISLIGGNGSKTQKSTKQLLDLINKLGINLKVFDFTLDEVVGVLTHYPEEKDRFIEGIETNSIHQNFKKLGYTDSKMYKLIAEIDFIMNEEFGIELLNFNTSKLTETEEYLEIKEFSNKNTYSKEHDQNAIEAIKFLRNGSSPRIIELSKFIFLSADVNLFQADLHVNKKSFSSEKIPNVITPQILSNFLWIKSPAWDSNLPIDVVFSSIYSYGLIDQEVWEKFYHNSQELISSGEISEEDFALLVTSNEFKNKLTVTNPEKISKPLIITNIKKEKKGMEGKIEKKVIKKVSKKHKEEINSKKEETTKEMNQEFIKKIRSKCNANSTKLTILIFFILLLVYIFTLCNIYTVVKDSWDTYEPLVWVIGIGILPVGYFLRNIKFSPYKALKNKINKCLVNKEIKFYLDK